MAVVYWIHLPEHTDILTQGYVGVSKTTSKARYRRHKAQSKDGSIYPIHAAIRKYGEYLLVSTIVVAEHWYCYLVENALRPNPEIGWNLARGGEQVTMLGRKHSSATKSSMSETRKLKGIPLNLSQRMREGNTYAHRAEQKDWANPKSNKAVWREAVELHKLFVSLDCCGNRKLATASNKFTADNLETITKKFKSGWVPSEDSLYLDWLKSD